MYYTRCTPTDRAKEERSLPPPAAGEVQVAVQATGLCGSDLHYFNHFRNGDIRAREPLTLGHESSGVVVAVAADVSSLAPGDRIALEVGLPCEECGLCTSGRYNICKGMRFGSSAKVFPHVQGTLQERINHPAKWCHKCVPPRALTVKLRMDVLLNFTVGFRMGSLSNMERWPSPYQLRYMPEHEPTFRVIPQFWYSVPEPWASSAQP